MTLPSNESTAAITISERWVEVAAAAIFNKQGQLLLSKRLAHQHQGGLWEFPGGKLEAGESAQQALCRELLEELAIEILKAEPLILVQYQYPDKNVRLQVFRVTQFNGVARGVEGQAIEWVKPSQLTNYAFPAANLPIVKALQTPDQYAITHEIEAGNANFKNLFAQCQSVLEQGIQVIRFRNYQLTDQQYFEQAKLLATLCQQQGAGLMLDRYEPQLFKHAAVRGLHLNRHQLKSPPDIELAPQQWLAASCHNAEELKLAEKLGVQFALLSPVLVTRSHPNAKPLGWDGFRQLVKPVNVPVFALGGLAETDLNTVRENGGQGVSGVSAFFK